MNMPLLVLRPQPAADRTVAQAREAGFEATAYPLFAVRAMMWDAPPASEFDALLFTSANAPRTSGAQLAAYARLPVYAVGAATARAARAAGFVNVVTGDADAGVIAARIAADGHRAVLHLRGAQARAFDPHGLNIISVPVYASEPAGDAEGLTRMAAPLSALLVHSPRAGERIADLTDDAARGALHIIAISENALAACGAGWASARAANVPTTEAMLELAREIYR